MKTLILSLIMATSVLLSPGDKAPNFSAESTNGTQISLTDFLGKQNVVLYFYPEDMTSGCTIEAHKFRDDQQKYKDANTVVLGVSLDNREMHQEFTEKDSLNFPLLVDANGKIAEAYGVPVDGHHVRRWTYLIGKDGTIIKKYDKVNVQTHSTDILADIAEYDK